jgi:hypothetical protein
LLSIISEKVNGGSGRNASHRYCVCSAEYISVFPINNYSERWITRRSASYPECYSVICVNVAISYIGYENGVNVRVARVRYRPIV